MNIPFKVNEKYTLITVTDFLAITSKSEIIVTRSLPDKRWAFRYRGKRKEYYFPRDLKHTLLFEGHNLPLLVDSETSRWFGNAKFNFVTDQPEKLKAFIVQNCLNPDPEKLGMIRVTRADRYTVYDNGQPLFPDTQTQA